MSERKRNAPRPASKSPQSKTPDAKASDAKTLKTNTSKPETPKTKTPDATATDAANRRAKRPLSAAHPVLYMVIMLTSLTAVLAFLLGFVNGITAPIIERLRQEALVASVTEVLPETVGEPEIVEGTWTAPVQTVRRAYDGARNLIGYAVEVAPGGFGGPITTVVGVNPDGTITGVRIIDMKETPNIGTKAQEPAFLDQFAGKAPGFALGAGASDVHAISGATVSSTAVYNGVAAASAAVLALAQ
ncbi:MAG: FMN-binding protein [Oscillospiraceae bacterium]|nr:FMN-binding protein [Oscillospiraceae bacterium]